MARVWTPMQARAIATRDKTLLVSAAAGSGKTATLTERIIRSMLDADSPIGIEEMLIVTFTRAAAGELRERIGAAVRSELERSSGNEYLERQLHMLPSAKICTIDSFCSMILRANCDRVGVSPTFRVADTAEAEILGEGILDGLISSILEGEETDVASAEDFDRLADCLTDTRSERDLAAILKSLYESTRSALEGVGAIEELIREYDPTAFRSPEATSLGSYAVARLTEACEHYRRAFTSAIAEIDMRGNPKSRKLRDTLAADVEFFDRVLAARDYGGIREALSGYEFGRTPPAYDPTLPPVTALRAMMKKDLTERLERFFSYTVEDWRTAYAGLYRELTTLCRVLRRFDEEFMKEKLRRGILEYSDIERYAYECLWQDGELTEIALSERSLYRAVYIDEYQDVNNLQNKIFEAISTENNRFMVGDIKQSIYGFRSANTDIFASMKRTFPPIDESEGSPSASIFMSDNFRCDRGVVDFVNDVFDRLFHHLREGIGYVEGDRLGYAKCHEGGEPPYRYPEICVTDAEEFPAEVERTMHSPLTVAMKIRELLDGGVLDDGTPIAPGHIAIIMRNAKGKDARYSRALETLGIPAAIAEDKSYFLNSEVLLALCLLNSIDNPRRDVYLAGLMCSPLYGFTPDDLTAMRASGGDSLFDSLREFAAGEGERARRAAGFVAELEYYRTLSEGMPTDELIAMLYKRTGLLALGSRLGGRDNLMLLYENARRFEAGSYRGLYNFISYINNLIDRKNSFDKREAPTDGDSVRIITAHSSKGLEFPIVFFVDGEESFNRSHGVAPRYLYKEGFGIGMLLRTDSGVALVENPTRAVIAEHTRRMMIEEEARVLYVALTRARERLYVVASPKKKRDEYLEGTELLREYLSDYSVYSLSCYLEMMLCMRPFRVSDATGFLGEAPKDQIKHEETLPTEDGESAADTDGLHTTLRARFNYTYPDAERTRLPEKVSVSKLYPAILDGSEEGVLDLSLEDEDDGDTLGRVPRFISGSDDADSKQRGIATHLFLQFCDLERLERLGAEGELKRLTEDKFLSERDASLVRLDEAEMFARSTLCRDMRRAKSLLREFRFNVKLPASLFTTDERVKDALADEGLLVQGVMDCLMLDERGEYHLVDYKTDRLTDYELSHPFAAAKRLYKTHSRQLGYYAEAVRIIFGKYPKTVEVYSLHLGQSVDVSAKKSTT